MAKIEAEASTVPDESDSPIVATGQSQDESFHVSPEECEFLAFKLQNEHSLLESNSVDSLFIDCDIDFLNDFSGVSISKISTTGVNFGIAGESPEKAKRV